jgi:hypothetical protein
VLSWRNVAFSVLVATSFATRAQAQAPGSVRIQVDNPAAGQTVAPNFRVQGWAIDTTATGTTGLDSVHVFIDGPADRGSVVGIADSAPRPDVAESFGRPDWLSSGFAIEAMGIEPGQHTLYVYAFNSSRPERSFITIAFTVAATRSYCETVPSSASRAAIMACFKAYEDSLAAFIDSHPATLTEGALVCLPSALADRYSGDLGLRYAVWNDPVLAQFLSCNTGAVMVFAPPGSFTSPSATPSSSVTSGRPTAPTPSDSELVVQIESVGGISRSFPWVDGRACNRAVGWRASDIRIEFAFYNTGLLPTLDSGSYYLGELSPGECRSFTASLTALQVWRTIAVDRVRWTWRPT